MDAAHSPEGILRLGFGFWASKALLSAVELKLFTHLADGPLDRAALVAALAISDRAAGDFLDALVALKLLEREGGKYRNSAEAEEFLVQGKEAYIGGALEMANQHLYPFWGQLTDVLRTGEPASEAGRADDIFAALYADPVRLDQFLRAMTGVSLVNGGALAAKFPWADYRSVVDVGCAQGAVPVQLARHHPHLDVAGFDLPAVQPIFRQYVAERGLGSRVRFIPGDFFRDSLPPAQVIVMGHILHDWGLEQKRMLVGKAYAALPPGGAYCVYDAMIDDERRENAFGLLMSLNMRVETPQGYDYTVGECRAWLREAGFSSVRQEALNGPYSLVVGLK